MSNILLEAELRTDMGKGASRRLRRENSVPGILYGGGKKPKSIHLQANKLNKALEAERIYSSIFDIEVDGKVEHVILKALQRHPYKKSILHLDLQRVSKKDVLVKLIPIHFINEQKAPGIKAGGIINHTMTQVEVRCQAQDLPEFIEVDMSGVELNEVIHLSHLKLPKGVQLSIDIADGSHDAPVVSIHLPRIAAIEEEEEKAEEASEEEASSTEETPAADTEHQKSEE
jgi:large subunit ribosomal protein L25